MATINIKNIDIVATWDYTSKNKECICNRSLHLPTVNDIDNKLINRNNIFFGECGHAYHKECLNPYLIKYDNMCPQDRLKWESKKINKEEYKIVN